MCPQSSPFRKFGKSPRFPYLTTFQISFPKSPPYDLPLSKRFALNAHRAVTYPIVRRRRGLRARRGASSAPHRRPRSLPHLLARSPRHCRRGGMCPPLQTINAQPTAAAPTNTTARGRAVRRALQAQLELDAPLPARRSRRRRRRRCRTRVKTKEKCL